VIERGARPCRRGVAGLARSRKELGLRRMTRIRRVVVVRLVAANARRGQGRVIVVDVAIAALARWDSVQAGQGKCGVGVIECGIGPDSRVMTDLTGCGEARCRMRWIVRAGVILLMARVAQNAVQSVVVVDVAIAAQPRRHGVITRQLKTGRRMIEFAVGPEHSVVARLARGGESHGNVVHRRGRVVVVVLMARNAGSRRDVVVVADVAIAALPRRHGVIAGQGEAGAVVVERRIQPRRSAVA